MKSDTKNKICTVTNLYPYPSQPTRGVFNYQLFCELEKKRITHNFVLVASSKPWDWPTIRRWDSPVGNSETHYIPYLHVPILGRNLSSHFVAHALRNMPTLSEMICIKSNQQSNLSDSVVCEPVMSSNTKGIAFLASWLYPDGIGMAEAFRGVGAPIWVMVLGSDTWHLKNLARRKAILKQDADINGYICVSQNLVETLAEAGIDRGKLHHIKNGVDTSKFKHLSSMEMSDWKEEMKRVEQDELVGDLLSLLDNTNSPLIGWIGNFVTVKAPEDALRSFAQVVDENICKGTSVDLTPQLVMIGDGPLLPRIRELAVELQVDSHVHLLGRRPHAEVPNWLNLISCLLLSSHSEGMPNVIAEALACGTPVVATDVGACREMLDGQPCCRISQCKNIEGMAKNVLSVYEEVQSLSKRPTFVRTWEDMADDICSLVQ